MTAKVKAIYKIPSLRHAFFITSPLCDSSSLSHLSQPRKERSKLLQKAILDKDRIAPSKKVSWKVKAIREEDFLNFLWKEKTPRKPRLDLLSINALKTPENPIFLTLKELEPIEELDILEIFI